MLKLATIDFLQSKEKTLFKLCASILLIIICFLHLWKLGTIPDGFFIDEASIAYNAYCIAETGADEYNNKYPVLFKCFGNYHDTVMVYSLVPIMKCFGLDKGAARLPSALFLVLASIAFYYLSLSFTNNRWFSLLGAFFFSILPWSFPVSRSVMSGYTPMLLGIVSGWLFIFKAFGRRSYSAAVLAAFFWAFAMYSHNCGRPMTAVYLIVFGLSMNYLLLKRVKIFICFTTSFIFFMLPMIFCVIKNPASMNARFNEISVWWDKPAFTTVIYRIFTRYIDYFSPVYLFWDGDKNLRHNIGGGELFLFMIPFILLGLYVCVKHFKKNPYYRFLLLGLLFYPLAAVLTKHIMHSTRSLNGAPFWCVLTTVGAFFLWEKRNKFKFIPLIMYCLLACGILETAIFMNNYFGKYQERSKIYFGRPFISALDYSFKELKPNETLYISGFFFPSAINADFKPYWYVVLLFTGKIPPAIYQKQGIPKTKIMPYLGQPLENAGIFLTSNCQPQGKNSKGQWMIQKNSEEIPFNAMPLKRIDVNSWRYITIFKIKTKKILKK